MKKFFFLSLFLSYVFAEKDISKIEVIKNPVMERMLLTLRDPKTPLKEFRQAAKTAGKILALELSKDLNKKDVKIKTILGKEASHAISSDNLVLVPILRGGLPLLDGFLEIFEDAESGFLAIKRNEHTLKPTLYYDALPMLEGKVVVLMDPMLATGGSVIKAAEIISKLKPKKIYFVSLFATREGIKNIKKRYPKILMYTGVIDPVLNEKGYIVPGLGDAGDRIFGLKVDHFDEKKVCKD